MNALTFKQGEIQHLSDYSACEYSQISVPNGEAGLAAISSKECQNKSLGAQSKRGMDIPADKNGHLLLFPASQHVTNRDESPRDWNNKHVQEQITQTSILDIIKPQLHQCPTQLEIQ